MIYAINRTTREHRIVPRLDVLSSIDWRYIQADADGWIECDGMSCPTNPEQYVQWKAGEFISGKVPANCVFWGNSGAQKINAYRPILEPQEQVREWDGESWPPPIGTLVESFASNGEGVKCEVLAVRGDKVIACTTDTHAAGWIVEKDTRPIRTDRERWVEKAEKLLSQCSDDEPLRYLCALTYDALVNGDLSMPEVKK